MILSGYIAECHYLDGSSTDQQTLVNTMMIVVFGNLKPIQVLMVLNGFYLDFEILLDLGEMQVVMVITLLNNITAADQATDTPTNNFCTMNMLNRTNGNSKNQEGATKVPQMVVQAGVVW